MCMLVFPEKVISGVPLIVRLIESVAHIVATVAANLQRARVVAFVIYNVHTHHVTIAETIVINTSHSKLVDVAR
ncbi:unknown [Prevotella sp. CAG:1092]|nr:unknown [Prevotella sp. CAG:1092]